MGAKAFGTEAPKSGFILMRLCVCLMCQICVKGLFHVWGSLFIDLNEIRRNTRSPTPCGFICLGTRARRRVEEGKRGDSALRFLCHPTPGLHFKNLKDVRKSAGERRRRREKKKRTQPQQQTASRIKQRILFIYFFVQRNSQRETAVDREWDEEEDNGERERQAGTSRQRSSLVR